MNKRSLLAWSALLWLGCGGSGRVEGDPPRPATRGADCQPGLERIRQALPTDSASQLLASRGHGPPPVAAGGRELAIGPLVLIAPTTVTVDGLPMRGDTPEALGRAVAGELRMGALVRRSGGVLLYSPRETPLERVRAILGHAARRRVHLVVQEPSATEPPPQAPPEWLRTELDSVETSASWRDREARLRAALRRLTGGRCEAIERFARDFDPRPAEGPAPMLGEDDRPFMTVLESCGCEELDVDGLVAFLNRMAPATGQMRALEVELVFEPEEGALELRAEGTVERLAAVLSEMETPRRVHLVPAP
jgi:hypothetical protein